eukprot:GSMAST32.ASY1.ANO1.1273.1 assembled CDS
MLRFFDTARFGVSIVRTTRSRYYHPFNNANTVSRRIISKRKPNTVTRLNSSFDPIGTPVESSAFDFTKLDFSDTRVAYQSKSTADIIRALIVFRICTITWLVKHSDRLLVQAKRVLGDKIVGTFFRPTFFRHFCAGEDESGITQTVQHLNSFGVGGILDYAAEADLNISMNDEAKVYEYTNEVECDLNMKIFEKCIKSVHNVSPEGFAAIKITALGNPKLLERVSQTLLEIRSMFFFFQFQFRISNLFFRTKFYAFLEDFDVKDNDDDTTIDYIEWTASLKLDDLWSLVRMSREKGPLAEVALDTEEMKLLEELYKRTDRLCSLAADIGVRVMIDAEQTYFQPAIDNVCFIFFNFEICVFVRNFVPNNFFSFFFLKYFSKIHIVLEMQRKYNMPGKNPVNDRAVVCTFSFLLF